MHIDFNRKNLPIVYCDTFIKRLIGMSFKRKKKEYIYCFPKCNSIHTFFMFQNIDVIMTDKNNNILYMYQNIKPNHIILPKKKVYYTYEFSHNNDLYNFFKNSKMITINNRSK